MPQVEISTDVQKGCMLGLIRLCLFFWLGGVVTYFRIDDVLQGFYSLRMGEIRCDIIVVEFETRFDVP